MYNIKHFKRGTNNLEMLERDFTEASLDWKHICSCGYAWE